MISTKQVNRFNMIRALIACGSPQIALQENYIVALIRHNGKMVIDETLARILFTSAYDILCEAIGNNPQSVELVEGIDYPEPVIRLTGGVTQLAYMLP